MNATKRLLIVDDEPELLQGLMRTLRGRFEVVCASSGQEGLERFHAEGPFPVVISDMRMPGMDGAAFLGHIRRMAPGTVRILLSGHLDLDAVLAAVNEGTVFRVLLKPTPEGVLASVLGEAFDHHGRATQDLARLQGRLEELQDQTHHLERLATLGTLAACVGHELNNLAQVFRSTLERIGCEVHENCPLHADHLQRLRYVSDHLAQHASTLLGLARKPSAGTLDVNLTQAVPEILEMLKEAGLFKGMELDLQVPEEPVRIRMARNQLEQVLLNLLRNAADALGEVNDRPARLRVTVEADLETHQARCAVEDTGCGITPAQLERIFQPFFTTKSPDRGTGLGLSVVRQIIQDAGGSIDVKSQPGQGSTFCMEFPMAEMCRRHAPTVCFDGVPLDIGDLPGISSEGNSGTCPEPPPAVR